MAEQSGDRQRREKGPPILTAEKGEHERAPSVGEIYLSSLCATLRAPPPKWAIKAFFPECRAAGFLWYFLSLRKKVLPSSGRQPHRPRRSRRVKPEEKIITAKLAHSAACSGLSTPSGTPKKCEQHHGMASPIRAGESCYTSLLAHSTLYWVRLSKKVNATLRAENSTAAP